MQRGGAVGIGNHHLEGREICIARVELAVVIGIEHVAQRLHVRGRGRVPFSELELVRRIDAAVGVDVKDQHAIAGAGPRRAVLVTAAGHVLELRGRAELGDVDPCAGEVEDDGNAEVGTVSRVKPPLLLLSQLSQPAKLPGV